MLASSEPTLPTAARALRPAPNQPRTMDLLLIGGLSGSGKNVALGALEDSGYYVVNNLPLPLLAETVDYLMRGGPRAPGRRARRQDRTRVSATCRQAIAALQQRGLAVRFLFLEAQTETLVKRFSETRRRHPFAGEDRTLTEAIEFERSLVADVRTLGFVFDTSNLPAASLRAWVKDFISVDPSQAHAAVRVVRLQARRAARRRPRLRRALPAQSALRGRAAAADRPRRAGGGPSSRRCPKSSACTATSTTSSPAGCPTTRATTATTSPSRSAAPAAATARSTSSSGWRGRSRRGYQVLKRHRELD